MYTVGRVSELTGIPPDTLRKWERRYHVVSPDRTDGNYRLYDEQALRRLGAMRALVDAGWSPALAAARVLADDGVASGPRPGEGGGSGDVDGLARAAEEMDPVALNQVLDHGFSSADLAVVIDDWLLPSLGRLGLAWREGRVGVAGEHFASAGVQRRLAAAYDSFADPPGAPHVVVGLAGGSRHELGVLAFAALLRQRGLRVTYVGGDLPGEAWLASVGRLAPEAVVIGVPIEDDVPAVREVVAVLADRMPGLEVFLGGAYQDRVDGGTPLGHLVGEAARSLATRLGVSPGSR